MVRWIPVAESNVDTVPLRWYRHCGVIVLHRGQRKTVTLVLRDQRPPHYPPQLTTLRAANQTNTLATYAEATSSELPAVWKNTNSKGVFHTGGYVDVCPGVATSGERQGREIVVCFQVG